jgi:hypothetical protein
MYDASPRFPLPFRQKQIPSSKTLSDHFQELGADFGEEIERRASDAKLILETAAKHGIPVEMLWKPS